MISRSHTHLWGQTYARPIREGEAVWQTGVTSWHVPPLPDFPGWRPGPGPLCENIPDSHGQISQASPSLLPGRSIRSPPRGSQQVTKLFILVKMKNDYKFEICSMIYAYIINQIMHVLFNYVLQFSNGAVVKLSSVLYISNWAYLYNTFYILSFKKFKIDTNFLFSFFCCRILLAVLLKHHDLGHAALAIVEQGDHSKHSVPKSISELFKVVSKTKRSLIQVFRLHVLSEEIDCTLSLQKFDSLNVHNIK